MKAQITEYASSNRLDLDALQSYLQLHVLHLQATSRLFEACFGALLPRAGSFHLKVEILTNGALRFGELQTADSRVLLLTKQLAGRLRARQDNSLQLSFWQAPAMELHCDRATLISLASHEQLGFETYQIFEFSEPVVPARAVTEGPPAQRHCVCHLLLYQHCLFRSGWPMPSPYLVKSNSALALTARQLQIVQLIAGGMTDKQIAARLSLSPHTVHNLIHRLLRRHAMHKRTQLCQLLSSSER